MKMWLSQNTPHTVHMRDSFLAANGMRQIYCLKIGLSRPLAKMLPKPAEIPVPACIMRCSSQPHSPRVHLHHRAIH